MTESTDRLLRELVDDLAPVRTIPPLRAVFAVVLGAWTALLGLALWASPEPIAVAALVHDEVYGVAFLGLAMTAIGGTLSALAAGVPGRERLEVAALTTAWIGLSVAVIACLGAMFALGSAALGRVPVSPDGMCFRYGVIFTLLPAAIILGFLARAWAVRPVRAAAVVLIGSGALGALVAHLGCGVVSPRHVLIGHLGVPIVLALLGLYPLGVLLRRWRE